MIEIAIRLDSDPDSNPDFGTASTNSIPTINREMIQKD